MVLSRFTAGRTIKLPRCRVCCVARAQVDFSHKPGSSDAHEAHPVEHHVAVDMAQARLRSEADTRWDMSDEIANFRERMEWKHHFTIGRPARR